MPNNDIRTGVPPAAALKRRAIEVFRRLVEQAESESAFGEVGVMVDFRKGVPYRFRKVVNTTEEQP